jgi:Ca2+-binding RTX toxin-like protein
MAVTRVTNAAVDNLRIIEFFDPNAEFNFGSDDEVSLVSRDGYELVLQGTDFAFDSDDEPTDGTITDVFLYDPSGDLVGRIEDLSHSLEDYYDTVAVDERPGQFVSEIMAGADNVTGGAADDYLEGYGGNDRISGGIGFDFLLGNGGNDTINGGDGEDDIDGGAGNDVVSGGDHDDLIYGYDGNDDLSGDAGYDTIEGEAGNDTISGGSGRDKLYGGLGNDSLNGGAQGDRVEGGVGDDRVSGGGGDDLLGGGSENDTLNGGAGYDEMYGDSDHDVLNGQAGRDSLDGGSGDDTLTGGPGRDALFGGLGDDQFVFRSDADGADVVLDFERGEDKLVFHAAGFDNLGADFDLVVAGMPRPDSGDATFLFDTTSHNLYYDADGNGGGDNLLVAELDDVSNLSKNDFLIV